MHVKKLLTRSIKGRRRLTVAGLAICMGLAGTIAGVAPAQAVSAPFRVTGTSLDDSTATKSARATCPTGTEVFGAGGFLVNGNGSVGMEAIKPDNGLSVVDVTATENGAFSGNWRVVAQAICGTPVANLHLVTLGQNDIASPTSRSVSPPCPAGTKLYGLGGVIVGGSGNVFFDDLTPSAELSSARILARENGAYASNWNLLGYAICGNPAATMFRQTPNPTISDSNSPKDDRAAFCPDNTRVHGVGAEINGGFGNVVFDDLQLTDALVTSTAKAYENGAYASNWSVTSYVICAS